MRIEETLLSGVLLLEPVRFGDARGFFSESWNKCRMQEHGIDPSRIRNELGWRPSVTVEEGLEKTVQWYLDNEAWWRALQNRDGVGERLGTGK